jgi:predicted lipid-binding transport protein (Tim44 family)
MEGHTGLTIQAAKETASMKCIIEIDSTTEIGQAILLAIATGASSFREVPAAEADVPASEQVVENPPQEEAKKPAARRKPADKPAPAPEPEPEQVDPPADPEDEVDPLGEDPVDEKTYTEDEVRTALKAYREVEGSAAMMEILRTHGDADSMATLKPAKYAAVMAAIK